MKTVHIKLSLKLLMSIVLLLMVNIIGKAQEITPTVTHTVKWLIPSVLCPSVANCNLKVQTDNGAKHLFVLNPDTRKFYVWTENSSIYMEYELPSSFNYFASRLDFTPLDETAVILFNGLGQIFKFELSTGTILPLAADIDFKACKNDEYLTFPSFGRLNASNLIMTCVRSGHNLSIEVFDVNQNTFTVLDNTDTIRGGSNGWYKLLAGQDGNVYRQDKDARGLPPSPQTIEVFRRSLQDTEWKTIGISEQDLLENAAERYTSRQLSKADVVFVDKASNIYLNLSWYEQQANGDLFSHYRLAKVTPDGQKSWIIAENVPYVYEPTLLNVFENGTLLILEPSSVNGNIYEVQEMVVTSSSATSTSVPTATYTTLTATIAITSTPTSTPALGDLRAKLSQCVTDKGLLNSLTTKLDKQNYDPFINEVQAQRGKKITEQCADEMITLATYLREHPTPTPTRTPTKTKTPTRTPKP